MAEMHQTEQEHHCSALIGPHQAHEEHVHHATLHVVQELGDCAQSLRDQQDHPSDQLTVGAVEQQQIQTQSLQSMSSCSEPEALSQSLQQLEQKHKQAVCDLAAKDVGLEELASAALAQQAGACHEIERLQHVLRNVQAKHQLILGELREGYQANLELMAGSGACLCKL